MPSPLDLPELPTLRMAASWLNAAGNLDRAACVELRVSELRRALGLSRRDKVCDEKLGLHVWRRVTEPMPCEKPAGNGKGRISSGIVSLREADLMRALRERPPRRMAGDWRTQRAPAMRLEGWTRKAEKAWQRSHKEWKGFKNRVYGGKWFDGGPPAHPPINPNHRRGGTKTLGLPEGWRQSVRVEKWRIKNRRTPMYYFVCPCGAGLDGRRDEPGLAKLSTRPLGFLRKGCPQRVLFLMLVQATAGEWRDAQRAWEWMRLLPAVPPPRLLGEWSGLQAKIELLERRYGVLFPPRRMRCRQCLGVKYGNHPETVRRAGERFRSKRREEAMARRLETDGPGTLAWVRRVHEAIQPGQERQKRSA